MSKSFVSMWGNAVSIAEHRPEGYAKDITLRYPVYAPFSGDKLRFTFDNYCGTEPVTISHATVAIAAFDLTSGFSALSCPQKDEVFEITFDGQSSVCIPAGGTCQSDVVTISVKRDDTLCVNLYLQDFTLMRSAVFVTGPLSKGHFSLGDQTHTSSLSSMTTKTTSWFYFLSNIDILTDEKNQALLCYGDSITAQSWPDYLSLRAIQSGKSHTSIVRRAASGTRILRQYECITYDYYGLKGENRIHHEIPTSGAKAVIIQQGINDIIHPVGTDINEFRPMSDLPTVDDMIHGFQWYITEIHKMGLKVYLGTLLPIYGWRTYAPFRETLKNEVNEWIRTNTEADGCVDFDLALRDEKNPAAFHEGYDSGDHLHPSELGYQKMAETVPDDLLDL